MQTLALSEEDQGNGRKHDCRCKVRVCLLLHILPTDRETSTKQWNKGQMELCVDFVSSKD